MYVPDRYARQFGQEQLPLKAVHGFERHNWSISVDWSRKYASDIKKFELASATHCDYTTTVPATPGAAVVFAPATTTQSSLGFGALAMVTFNS